jgi:hypothetical protein
MTPPRPPFLLRAEGGGARPAATAIDWPDLKARIVAGLNVEAEYAALGVEFTRPAAGAKGWRECRAVGRAGNPDDVPSAAVNVATGVYKDSGDGGVVLGFFDFALRFGGFGRWIDAVRHYAEKAGVEMPAVKAKGGGRIEEARHEYRDAAGAVRYAVFRYRLPNGKKTFTQHPADGRGGWRFGSGCMDGVQPLPYRLPELLATAETGEPAWAVEGEKDADRLAAAGLVATTGHGGCGSTDATWPRFEPSWFAGRVVFVVPDHDEPGRAHARKVAAWLLDAGAKPALVELPGLPPKGDVSDWLDSGHTVEELWSLASRAEPFDPSDPGPAPELFPAAEPDGPPWEEPMLDAAIPAVPFPVGVLPPALAELVDEAAECLGCPPDYPAVACLAAASGAIGRSVALALKDGWVESASIYAALVGDPGMTKSPALHLAARPLWRLTEELLRAHREREEAAAEEDTEAPAPPLPRVAVDDTTVEALAPILRENPRGIVMVRDELTAWVAGLNQYKNGKGADRQFFLSAWSGSPVMVDRKGHPGRAPIHVPRPFLSVVGALTPAMLTSLSESRGRDDGFLDRMLFCLPDRVRVRWDPRGIRPAISARWDEAVRRLWARPLAVGDDARPRPQLVAPTPEAAEVFAHWFDTHCAEAEDADFPAHLRGAWSKFRAYCGRLALVLALLRRAFDPAIPDDAPPPAVDARDMDAAIRLVAYFKCHTRRVRALLRGGGEENDDARALVCWLRRRGRPTFSERDARRNFRARFAGDGRALRVALAWLTGRRCIRARPPCAPRPGRPGSPSYDVNPALLDPDPDEEDFDAPEP